MSHDDSEFGRAEAAFRAGLTQLDAPPAPEPEAVRRTYRTRRAGRTAVLLGLAVVAVVGGWQLAGLAQNAGAPIAAQPAGPAAPVDPAPTGWRTERFRDITFEVPANWGYAVPPGSSWCAGQRDGQPRPEQASPYVWLDLNRPVESIACEPLPDTLITEHVEALAVRPAVDYAEGSFQTGPWWVVTRFKGNAILSVTSQDRTLAERIVDSSRVVGNSALCPPVSPVAGPLGARPSPAVDLGALKRADWALVCQYEPVESAEDVALPKLRAAQLRTGAEAQDLLEALQSAPVNTTTCRARPYQDLPDVALLVRIAADGTTHDLYVAAAGCADGDGSVGGIDDGQTVRVLDRKACQALLQPPITLFAANGDVGRSCLG